MKNEMPEGVCCCSHNMWSSWKRMLIIIARIEMKLGTLVYYIISMTATCFHDNYMFVNNNKYTSLKLLLHSSNSLTVARMEKKLGMHVYYIVSMMTTYYLNNNK